MWGLPLPAFRSWHSLRFWTKVLTYKRLFSSLLASAFTSVFIFPLNNSSPQFLQCVGVYTVYAWGILHFIVNPCGHGLVLNFKGTFIRPEQDISHQLVSRYMMMSEEQSLAESVALALCVPGVWDSLAALNEFYDSTMETQRRRCGSNVDHSSADPTCSWLLAQKHISFEKFVTFWISWSTKYKTTSCTGMQRINEPSKKTFDRDFNLV